MAIKKTIIESDPQSPQLINTTRTTVNPDIHTQIVEDQNVIVDSDSPTVTKTRVIQEPLVKTEHPQKTYEKKKFILRTNEVIWTILGIIELLLGFRIALKALGANPSSDFVSLIYAISTPLAAPFQGILRSNIGDGASYFEWSTIIAAIVYLVIAYVITLIIDLVRPVSPEEVESTI